MMVSPFSDIVRLRWLVLCGVLILHAATLRPAHAQVVPQDSLALVALYNATGGPAWTNNANWLTGPVGTWHGISITGTSNDASEEEQRDEPLARQQRQMNERVLSVLLDNNNLNGMLPPEIGDLDQLSDFLVRDNPGLTGFLPLTMVNMAFLFQLRFSGTDVCEPQNPGFQDWISTIEIVERTGLFCQPQLDVDPTELDYGNVPINTFVQQMLTLRNVGDSPLNVSDALIQGNDANAFAVFGERVITLQPGAEAQLVVEFFPARLGVHMADLEIMSDGGDVVVPLLGNGVMPELLEQDSLALVALYNATNGPGWTNNTNWLSGPASTWYGVTVGEGGVTNRPDEENEGDPASKQSAQRMPVRVLALDLGTNNLSGPLPDDVGQLLQLQRLDINTNNLDGALPLSLTNLIGVNTFYYFGTNLCEPQDPDFQDWLSEISDLDGSGLTCNPVLTVDPDPTVIDFGDVEIGQVDKRLLTLSNTGQGPLTISSVDLVSQDPAAFFVSDQFNRTIPAGESVVVDVEFQPMRSGAHMAEVNVFSDGGNAFVDVLGNGVEPGPTPLQQDSLALVALYNATSGPGWLTNTNWLTGPVSTWHGVTVVGDRVTEVDLNGNGLMGMLPPETGSLPNLTSLLLSGNQLTGPIPIEVSQLASLRILELGANQLDGPIPIELGSLSNLEQLSLGGNQLTGDLPPELGDLVGLTLLDVQSNPLMGPLALELTNLTDLVTFRFNGTELCTPPDPALQMWLDGISDLMTSGLDCVGVLDVSPATYDFDGVPVGITVSTPIVLRNIGNFPLDVTDVSVSGADMAAFAFEGMPTGVLQPDSARTVMVTFSPSRTGSHTASLDVTSDGGNAAVPLAGTGTSGMLTADPTTLDFSTVATAEADTLILTLTNTGTTSLTVGEAALMGDDAAAFTQLDAAVGVLEPAQSRTVRVVFTPGRTGSHTASLRVPSDANEVTVALSGTGIEGMLAISPATHDFGEVVVGTAGTVQVTLTNTGTAPLEVTGATLEGADAAVFSLVGTATGVLEPDESRTFDVVFTPERSGAHVGSLAVSSDGGNETVALSGTGTQGVLSVTPLSHDFEAVAVGSTASIPVEIRNTGTASLEVTSTLLGGDDQASFGFSGTHTGVLAPGEALSVDVTFTPARIGSHTARLDVTSDVGDASVGLMGLGVAGRLEVAPEALMFESTPVGASRTLQLTLTNTGTAPLEVTDAVLGGADAAAFSLAGTTVGVLEPAQSRTFDVVFTPERIGDHEAQLNVTSDGGDVAVMLSGIGTEGLLMVEPETLSFEPTLVGATDTLTVRLTNTGNASLTVGEAAMTGDDAAAFTQLDAAVGVLQPAQSRTVRVVFTPSRTGSHTASLLLTSDANDVPVPLSGTGTMGMLTIDPETHGFGEVVVGASGRVQLMLTNTGTAPLEVTGAALGGADAEAFSLVGTAAGVLEPAQSRRVDVVFRPERIGDHEARLDVTSDGGDVAVMLSGIGTEGVLVVEPQDLSFEPTLVGATDTLAVRLTNTGNASLTVGEAALTGDDAAAFTQLDAAVGVLQPAQSRTVRVVFTPSRTGSHTASLLVPSDGGNGTVALSGIGIIRSLTVDPEMLTYGDVAVGETAELTVTLTNEGNVPLTVTAAELRGADAAMFDLLDTAEGTLNPAESRSFRLRFAPTRMGAFSVQVDLTSDTGEQSIPVTGRGVAGLLVVEPNELAFEAAGVGTSRMLQLTLTNTGNASLEVTDAAFEGADEAAFSLEGTATGMLEPAASRIVDVVFTPARMGSHAATLTITSNANDASVPLNGTGIAGVLTLNPLSHAFGTQALGGQSTTAVTLTNTGAASLTITDVMLTGADVAAFAWSGDAIGTLGPDASRTVTVSFSPQRLGDHTAQLDVVTPQGTESFSLTGTGALPEITIDVRVPDPGLDGDFELVVNAPPSLTATLFYRQGGMEASAYQAQELSFDGVALRGAVPEAFLTARGLDYYLEFSDGQQTFTFPLTDASNTPFHAQVRIEELATPTAYSPRRYQMISVPLVLDDARPLVQLEDDLDVYTPLVWRLLHYTDGIYDEGASLPVGLEPGQGFWYAHAEGRGFSVGPGLSVPADAPFVLSLRPGWNQIGTPFAFPVAWADAEVPENVGRPVSYDGVEYLVEQTVLLPWQGYFVYNGTGSVAEVRIPPRAAEAAAKHADLPWLADLGPDEWVTQIAVHAPGGDQRDTQTFVGMRTGAMEGRDVFDFAEAPPPPGGGIQVAVEETWGMAAGSFRPPTQDGQVWTLRIQSATQRVHLSLRHVGAAATATDRVLMDASGATLQPTANGIYEVSIPGGTRQLKLIAGSQAFVEETVATQVHATGLLPNYPNPFVTATQIRYGLAEAGPVEVVIYNVLGQEVRRWSMGQQETGTHALAWDGRDRQGRSVSPGLYVCTLQAGATRTAQTMVRIR